MGCPLTREENNGEVVVSGNNCQRGEVNGKEEYTHPKRNVTSLVETVSGGVASCKTSTTVSKEKIFDVVAYIGKLRVPDDVKIGDVVAKNVLDLGADVVITGRK